MEEWKTKQTKLDRRAKRFEDPPNEQPRGQQDEESPQRDHPAFHDKKSSTQ